MKLINKAHMYYIINMYINAYVLCKLFNVKYIYIIHTYFMRVQLYEMYVCTFCA